MLVDYERVVLALKRELAQKSHHGQRELFALIARLEVKHSIDEGLAERAIRLYGLDFYEEAIKGPSSGEGRVPGSDGRQVRASRGDSNPESEEDNNGRDGTGEAGSSDEHDGRADASFARGGVVSIGGRSRAFD